MCLFAFFFVISSDTAHKFCINLSLNNMPNISWHFIIAEWHRDTAAPLMLVDAESSLVCPILAFFCATFFTLAYYRLIFNSWYIPTAFTRVVVVDDDDGGKWCDEAARGLRCESDGGDGVSLCNVRLIDVETRINIIWYKNSNRKEFHLYII